MRLPIFGAALAVGLLLVAGSALAQAPAGPDCPQALPIAPLLAQAALAGLAGSPTPAAPQCYCSATAHCSDGSTVSCSDSSGPCDCTGVDASCSAGQRGYVSCNGVTTYCPVCPPPSGDCAQQCKPCGIGQIDPCGLCTCVRNVCSRISAWECF